MKKSNNQFDVIIAGGGMVGATTAIALSTLNLKIALVESNDFTDTSEEKGFAGSNFDQRSIALSAASVNIYRSLGLWQDIKSIATAIDTIHVSNKGHFGFTRLSAKESGVEELGQVVPLDEMGPLLWKNILQNENIATFCPQNIIAISHLDQQTSSDTIVVNIKNSLNSMPNNNQTITAKLLLATDGTFSSIAEMAGIKMSRDQYLQSALIANIKTEKPHQGKAFERFTNQGPLALLPLTGNRMSLVWCQDESNIRRMMSMDNHQFTQDLQEAFGFRLGRITKVGERNQYPLALHLPEKAFLGRTLLLGNAAHTLHPIAGQGFNLALRDIAALMDHISLFQTENKTDIGDLKLLANYCKNREPDWRQTIEATDSLVRIFSNDYIPLTQLRGLGLAVVDKLSFLKKRIANQAMGFSGNSSKLVRRVEK